MFVICLDCGHELKATPAVCEKCGALVDLYSCEYERQLISALASADADTRAQICLVLGSRRKRSAIPTLIELLHDPDVLVRLAALRGLGEIGDASAVNAVEQLTDSKETIVQTVAKNVLKMLIHAQGSIVVGTFASTKVSEWSSSESIVQE
jgi:HEAT repeat protein